MSGFVGFLIDAVDGVIEAATGVGRTRRERIAIRVGLVVIVAGALIAFVWWRNR
jgi:hypothetical protein